MLGVLAVALALTSPLPLPRPAVDAPARAVAAGDAGTEVTIVAPETEPAWPAGRQAAGAPVPLPAERPVTLGKSRPGTAGLGADRPTDAGAGAGADASPGAPAASARRPLVLPVGGHDAPAVPVPPERPGPTARAEAGGRAGPDESNDYAPTADEVPKPVARPRGGQDGEGSGTAAASAPIVMAMVAPGQAPPPGHDRPTAPRDMVCRDPRIVGAPAASFVGNIPGCGIFEPVRVASISGIGMSSPITVDCRTARAFADWLTGVAQPAARETMNSHIESLWIMGSYSCRSRNNQPGKRLSEHSAGRAIDLGGVTLANGRRVVVRDDWGDGPAGTFLRRIREGACGGFTTVLGPGSDRFHDNHLHLDTAYRGSTYCR